MEALCATLLSQSRFSSAVFVRSAPTDMARKNRSPRRQSLLSPSKVNV
jgi:hypothetical protein